ncbi:MAG: aspartate/glutamate racemase family protein [Candidatus Aminicenantes bacterium]|nr:aspartate/glutamate racemase family protein [Candidatus Aminicenantes bacterium]
MKKITLISTSLGTGTLMNNLFLKEFPGIALHNIVDDSLVKEIVANGDVISPNIVKRVCSYVVSAEMSGSDFVLITCSSISSIAKVAERLVRIPILRVDEPMAEWAIQKGNRIKVLATISATLAPTLQLLQEKSLMKRKEVTLDSSLCEMARTFLDEGRPEEHDRILREEIERALKNFDLVILAQASMARVLEALDPEKRKRVLTSPSLAIENIKNRFFTGSPIKSGREDDLWRRGR